MFPNYSAAIRGFSFSGEVILNIGIVEGVSVHSITLDLNFGVPEVDLKRQFSNVKRNIFFFYNFHYKI